MKKTVFVICVLVCICMFCACSGQSDEDAGTQIRKYLLSKDINSSVSVVYTETVDDTEVALFEYDHEDETFGVAVFRNGEMKNCIRNFSFIERAVNVEDVFNAFISIPTDAESLNFMCVVNYNENLETIVLHYEDGVQEEIKADRSVPCFYLLELPNDSPHLYDISYVLKSD